MTTVPTGAAVFSKPVWRAATTGNKLKPRMHYMIIEDFRGGKHEPVYSRFREKGRMAPAGLDYVSSWVTEDMATCYQVMRCEDRELLDE